MDYETRVNASHTTVVNGFPVGHFGILEQMILWCGEQFYGLQDA